jgi:hypothetical protein
MLVLPENKRLIIKFEDLIRSTETALQKICEFLSLEYDSKMKETTGVFENFVLSKKDLIDPEYTEKLLRFHTGIRTPLDESKIGQYKAFLSQKDLRIIEGQCQNQLKSFSYEDIAEKKISSVRFSAYHFLAFLYRPFLLKLYLQLPLGMKLKLKKRRNRRKSIPV